MFSNFVRVWEFHFEVNLCMYVHVCACVCACMCVYVRVIGKKKRFATVTRLVTLRKQQQQKCGVGYIGTIIAICYTHTHTRRNRRQMFIQHCLVHPLTEQTVIWRDIVARWEWRKQTIAVPGLLPTQNVWRIFPVCIFFFAFLKYAFLFFS